MGSLLDKNWFLTPNADYLVHLRAPQDRLTQESHYRKLRRTTVKFKYDANFVLFASDRKGTLDSGVAEELRRKMPGFFKRGQVQSPIIF